MTQTGIKRRDRAVVVFMRAPQLGRVKTRLAAALAPAVVLELYRCFVQDTLAAVSAAGGEPFLCIHPPAATLAAAAEFAGANEAFPQAGVGLGQRMANAFRRVFAAGRRQALLVGSDIPHLPPRVYRQAFDALRRHPSVIGPAADGGYYLIGFRHDTFKPAAFGEMAWGSGDVLETTCARLAGLGAAPYRLPPYRDIDRFEDLLALTRDAAPGAPATRACLRRHGLGSS